MLPQELYYVVKYTNTTLVFDIYIISTLVLIRSPWYVVNSFLHNYST